MVAFRSASQMSCMSSARPITSQVGDATFQGSILFAALFFVVLIFAAFKDN